MKKIVILTGNHLCHNPRVVKEATALAKAGFGVEVLGAWIDPVLKERDRALLTGLPFRFTTVLDATQDKLAWLKCRLRVRIAKVLHQRTGQETAWQLGYTTGALARAARQRQADLFIAHSEPGLWALTQIRNQKVENRKRQGEIGNLENRKQKADGTSPFQLSTFNFQYFQIGVDMEDWFSEDLTPEARKQRPVRLLKNLEQRALSHPSQKRD